MIRDNTCLGVSGSLSAQGYRELSYSESYHEAFLTQPIGAGLRNVQRDANTMG